MSRSRARRTPGHDLDRILRCDPGPQRAHACPAMDDLERQESNDGNRSLHVIESEQFERGLEVRREVLGTEDVDANLSGIIAIGANLLLNRRLPRRAAGS